MTSPGIKRALKRLKNDKLVSMRVKGVTWEFYQQLADGSKMKVTEVMRLVLEKFEERGGSIKVTVDDGSDKQK